MGTENDRTETFHFLKSLGFPKIRVHQSFNHFDFRRPARRILVIGPMGSGKTEYSARVWRDGEVARKKSGEVAKFTMGGGRGDESGSLNEEAAVGGDAGELFLQGTSPPPADNPIDNTRQGGPAPANPVCNAKPADYFAGAPIHDTRPIDRAAGNTPLSERTSGNVQPAEQTAGRSQPDARPRPTGDPASNGRPTDRASGNVQPADRRNVFFIRSLLDVQRFPEYPPDALAYRGGYFRCGENIAQIKNSFDFERVYSEHREAGTWIIDEASFYDERLVYLVRNESEKRGLIFIFPTLILNFRKDIFNSTARLMLETATDVFPLTAYCEHRDCIEDAFYTYRYYLVDGQECPALYFDPLIIVGGDKEKQDPKEPNYCARCDRHHYLPGKEYTFLVLNPLGMSAGNGNVTPLTRELYHLKNNIAGSGLYEALKQSALENGADETVYMNALRVSCIAEKALMYLYAEQNLVGLDQVRKLVHELDLDSDYMEKSLADNRRVVNLK